MFYDRNNKQFFIGTASGHVFAVDESLLCSLLSARVQESKKFPIQQVMDIGHTVVQFLASERGLYVLGEYGDVWVENEYACK